MVARHFAGDRPAAVAWLHAHAAESLIDRLVSEELDWQIKSGATCVAEEMPIIHWPDDDICYDDAPEPCWRERVSTGKHDVLSDGKPDREQAGRRDTPTRSRSDADPPRPPRRPLRFES